jgi:hypothetical protein
MVNWLKKAPTSIVITMIIVCGVLAAAVLVSFVYLQATGQNTTEFRQWINSVGNILMFPLLGLSTAASVQAARSSSNTEDQTNGTLTKRDDEIAQLRADIDALRARPSNPGGPV